MSSRRYGAAAIAFDLDGFDDFDDQPVPMTASVALVRGRDGTLRSVDVARLAWPDDTAEAGVDEMADILRYTPRGSC